MTLRLLSLVDTLESKIFLVLQIYEIFEVGTFKIFIGKDCF